MRPSMNEPCRGSPTPTIKTSAIDAGILGIPVAGTVSPSESMSKSVLLGCQGCAILAASVRPENRSVLPDSEGMVQRQVAEDVADHLEILGIDDDRLGAVVAGHDGEEVELDRDTLQERIHDDGGALHPALFRVRVRHP